MGTSEADIVREVEKRGEAGNALPQGADYGQIYADVGAEHDLTSEEVKDICRAHWTGVAQTG